MNNRKRTNPFRSQRINFPPLDEFFQQPSGGRSSPSDSNSLAHSLDQSFCSRTTTSAPCYDFSMDMSIGGQAALTEHRHHVQKYGIDNAGGEQNGLLDSDGGDRNSSLSDGDDWDRSTRQVKGMEISMTRIEVVANGDVAKIKVITFMPASKGDAMVNGVRSAIAGTMNGEVNFVNGKTTGINMMVRTDDIRKAISAGVSFVKPVKKDGK